MARIEFEKPDKASGSDILDALLGRAKKASSEFSGVHTLKLKVDGADKVLSELEDVNNAVTKYETLLSKKRNTNGIAQYFGTQEKMINSLKLSWNSFVDDLKEGKVNPNDLASSKTAKAVLRNANALEAAYGYDSFNMISEDNNIVKEITDFVSKMRSMDKFSEGNYNMDISHFKEVFSILKEINDMAMQQGVNSEGVSSIYQMLGLDNVDKITSSVKELLSASELFEEAMRKFSGNGTTESGYDNPEDHQQNDYWNDNQEDHTQEIDKETERIKDAADRQKKAFEDLEQIRNRAISARQQREKINFYDSDDFYEKMYNQENNSNGYTHWISIEEESIVGYQNALDKLADLQENALERARQLQNSYAEEYNKGNDIDADDYLRQMNEEIEYYNRYSDAIDYVQKQLSDNIMNFKPGDSWGVDEIQALISLLQKLVNEVQNVSKSFGQIDDESNITSLLSQFTELGTIINEVFNADNIKSFKSSLESLNLTLNNISKSIGVIGDGATKKDANNKKSIRDMLNRPRINNSPTTNFIDVSGTEVSKSQEHEKNEELYLNKQVERYEKAYRRIFEIYKKGDEVYNTYGNFLSGLVDTETFSQGFYGEDIFSTFSEKNIISKYKDPMERIKSIIDFFNTITKAMRERIDSDVFNQSYAAMEEDILAGKFDKNKSFKEWQELNQKRISEFEKSNQYYSAYKYITSSASPKRDMSTLRANIADINDIKKKKNKSEDEDLNDDLNFMDYISKLSNIKDYESKIEDLIKNIKELQNVFKQGLGISDDSSSLVFLDQIIQKFDEISKAATGLVEKLEEAFKKIDITSGEDSLSSQVQKALDSEDYKVKVGVDESSPLSDSVKKMLETETYKVKIEPAENTKETQSKEKSTEKEHTVQRQRADGSVVTDRNVQRRSETVSSSSTSEETKQNRFVDLSIAEKARETADAIRELENKTGQSLASVISNWDKLDAETKMVASNILSSVNLIKDDGSFNFVIAGEGSNTKGSNGIALLTDQFAILQKQTDLTSAELSNYISIIEALQKAGVNVASVFQAFNTTLGEEPKKGLFQPGYEIQERMKGSVAGTPIRKSTGAQEDITMRIQDLMKVLSLSDDQIIKFARDYAEVTKVLSTDPSNSGNFILSNKGVGFIDVGYSRSWQESKKSTPTNYEILSGVFGSLLNAKGLSIDIANSPELQDAVNQVSLHIAQALQKAGYSIEEMLSIGVLPQLSKDLIKDKLSVSTFEGNMDDFDDGQSKNRINLDDDQRQKVISRAEEEAEKLAKDWDIMFGRGMKSEFKARLSDAITKVVQGDDFDFKDISDLSTRDTFWKQGVYKRLGMVSPKDIKDYLKNATIKMLPEYEAEFGDDWFSFNRDLGFAFKKNKGQDLSEVIEEMNRFLGLNMSTDSQLEGLRDLREQIKWDPNIIQHFFEEEMGGLQADSKLKQAVSAIAQKIRSELNLDTPFRGVQVEQDDFKRKAESVLKEYGKTEADIPIEYTGFLTAISQESMTADEAVRKLRETLESLSSVPKPDNLGFEETAAAGKEAADGINAEGEAAKSATTAKENLANRNRNLKETMDATADAGKEAGDGIRAEEDAAKSAADTMEESFRDNSDSWAKRVMYMDADGNPVGKTEVSKEKRKNAHVSTSYYSEFEEDEDTGEKVPVLQSITQNINYEAAAKEAAKAEKIKQKAIENTNALIVRQEGNLDNIKKKYVENAGVELSDDDIKRLDAQYKKVTDLFEKYRDKETSKVQRAEIGNEIKEYQRMAQQAIKDQKVSTQLEADRPDVARERLKADIEKLLGEMKSSAADTTEQEQKLRDILKQLDNEYNDVEKKSPWLKQRSQDYKAVREENRAIQNQYRRDKTETDRYAELLMKKAKETNLPSDQQAELDQLTEKYRILNEIRKSGLDISKEEEDILSRVAKAQQTAAEERIKMQESLRADEEQYLREQAQKEADAKNKKDQQEYTDRLNKEREMIREQNRMSEEEQRKNAERLKNNMDIYNKYQNRQEEPVSNDKIVKSYEKNLAAIKNMKKDAEEAQVAMRELFKMMRSGDISNEQFKDALGVFREGKNEIKIEEQYKGIVNTFKQLVDATNEFNKFTADGINGKNIAEDDVSPIIQKIQQLSAEAEKAKESLDKLFNSGKISESDYNSAMSALDSENTYKTYKKVRQAELKANRKEITSQLSQYGYAEKQYETLYQKSLTKNLSTEEVKRMDAAMETIVQIEQNWNSAKAEGISLSQKQKDLIDHIEDARSGDRNSKEALKQNAINKQAIKIYDEMAKKINKMRDQSEWRAEGWDLKVGDLQKELDGIDVATVQTEKDFIDFTKKIGKLRSEVQETQKSTDFQPIGKDWQDKAKADLAKWMDQNKMAAKAFREELEVLASQIDKVGSKGQAEEWNTRLQGIIGQSADKGLMGKSLGDRFKDQFKNTMTSLATYYMSFQDFIRYGRNAIQIITELDTQLTEMRKVSSESLQTLQNYQLESFDIADRVGTTAAQIQASTADWMRLGEDLQEAKKSAEQSTLLLNVSEFTNIEDATKSLTSMSQAYKDIEKSDIIDKLNNIGNNFSISTSELAQSLQKSAGTLRVTGDSLDEAIALTVAGNQVLQSPDIVGQSLKTISLRLSGTSVKDMQEAGEEIDGLIETQSKLRQVILDSTKVASNNYKGFDILNDDGSYKTTYERLLGISEVFKEIGEEDKRLGTNRQSFLLETIAGKTRAAAASSILENPEVLKQVYEASQNSQGSAQEELDKYLDSINGKVAQFQNRFQELTTQTIDSQWIKDIVDFGTGAIKIVTQLSKTFGGLNTIIASVVSFFAVKNGKGLFSNGFSTSGIKDFGKSIKKIIVGGLDDDLGDFFNKEWAPGTKMGDAISQYEGLGNKVPIKLSLLSDEDKDKTTTSFMDELIQKSSLASKSMSLLKKVGTTALNSIATAGVSMIAQLALEFLIKGIATLIDNLIETKQEIIEAGTTAQNTVKELDSSYNEKVKKTNDYADRYSELRKGVRMDGNTITNVSLSSDQFDEFLNINQGIADLYPSLITGTSQYGGALVDLSNDASQAKQTINEYLDMLKSMHALDVKEELPDIAKKIKVENEEAQKEYDHLQNDIESNRSRILSLFDINDLSASGFYSESSTKKSFGFYKDSVFGKELQDLFEGAREEGFNIQKTFDDNGIVRYLLDGVPDESEELKRFKEYVNRRGSGLIEILNSEGKRLDTMAKKSTQNWTQNYVPHLIDSLYSSDSYLKLPDAVRDNLNTALYGFNWDDLDWDPEEIGDNVSNKIIAPIYDAINNGNISEIDVSNLFSFNYDELTNEQAIKQIDDVLSILFPDEEIRKTVAIGLNIMYEDENGKHYSITKNRDEIFQMFGGSIEYDSEGNKRHVNGENQQIKWDDIKKLTQSQQQAIFGMREAGKFDNGLPQYFSVLLKQIDDFINESNISIKEGKLSDIFKDEGYSESASNFETRLSSLTGALNSLRENGELTKSEMADLQETFADLSDFSEEGISARASKELSEWIKLLNEFAKSSELDDASMESLHAYIDNLVGSYEGLIVTAKDAELAVNNVFVNEKSSYSGQQMQSQKAKQVIDDLKNQYGEDINWSIVWQLAIDGTLATGDMDAIFDAYNNKEITWDINIEQQKLEKDIERRQAAIGKYQAANTLREAQGRTLRPKDYDSIIREQQGILSDKEKQVELALNQKNLKLTSEAQKAYDDAVAARDQAEADVLNSQKEQIEARTNNLQREINRKDTEMNKISAEIERQEKDYGKAEDDLYRQLGEQQKTYGDSQMELYNMWNSISNEFPRLAQMFGWKDNATNAYQAATTAYENSEQNANMPTTNQLDALKRSYTDLQEQAQAINDDITLSQGKGLKPTVDQYKKLEKISKGEIKNLKEQNKLLRDQYNSTDDEIEKAQYLSDIRSNTSTMKGLEGDIQNYSDQARNLALTNAQALAGAVSSALGEMATETGLTTDTIKTLTTQFSDLADSADISSIFYNTADGVKVDVVAMQRLAEAERDIASSQIQGDISTVQDMIKNLGADGDTTALQQYQDELARLSQQQSEVFAQYQAMMDAMNQHGMIELADQTKNAGAEYDKGIQYLKEAKEMWDKGLIGTDDFKERAKYFDAYGRTDAETFKSNYDRLSKYFNEEHPEQGIVKFWDDLVANGLATKGDGGIVSTFTDIDAAAQKMGMSLQAFEDTLLKTNDYGSDFVIVKSMEDAMLQTKDLNHELAEAQTELTKMQTAGAPKEAIEAQQKEVQAIKDRIGLVDQARQNMEKSTAEAYKTGLRNFGQYMDAMKGYYAEAEKNEDYESMAYYAEQMRAEAGKYGIELDAELNFDPTQVQQKINEVGRSGSFEVPLRASDFGYYSEGNQDRIFESGQQQIAKNREEVEKYAEVLKGLNYDQLNQIQLGNGQYDVAGLEAAEDALEHIATAAGLSQEQVGMLVPLLASFGLIDFSTPETGMEELNNATNETIEKVRELQANGTVELSFDIEDNGKTIDNLKSQIAEIEQQKAKLAGPNGPGVGSSEWTALDNLQQQKEKVLSIRTEIEGADNAQAKLQELQNMSDEDLAAKLNVDVNSDEFQALKADIQNMSGEDLPLTVHIQDDQMSQLTSTNREVTAQVAGQAEVQELKAAIDQLPQNKNIPVTAKVTGTSQVNALRQAIVNVPIRKVVNVVTNMVGATAATINALSNAIRNLQSKTITVTTIKSQREGVYTGTMLSPSSHATGTVRKIEKNGQGYNVLNLKPIGGAHAKGSGDISLDQDEESLVNELGQESVIRDGKWFLLPAGMHVEQLKKGDIVLNHLQTEDLLEHGKTFGKGRIKGGISSLATGTAWNGMPSHADGPAGGFTGLQGGVATSSSTKATKAQTKAVKDNTKATKGNSKSKQKEAEVIDWVEVRLERLGRATDNVAKTITDFVSKIFKKTQLTKQIQKVQDQIDANIEGQKKYEERAKKVKFTEKEAVYRDKVLNGKMQIEDIKDENLQKKIADYKEWTEKALDCRDAVQELRNTQLELFADWAHIPTEYAEKAIDKLAAKYDELEDKTKMASGGGSKIATYAKLQAEERATELDKVNSQLQERSDTAQKELASKDTALNAAKDKVKSTKEKQDTEKEDLKTATDNLKKKLSSSQWKSIKKNYIDKNKAIPSKVLKSLAKSKNGAAKKKLAEEYNKQLKELQNANKEAKSATTAQSKAQTAYDTAVDSAAKTELSMEELRAGRTAANDIYQAAKTDAATKKETKDKKDKALADAKTKASNNKTIKNNSAAKNAIKNGKAIDDKTLKALKKKSKTAYDLAKKYNDTLKAANTATNAYNTAEATRKEALAELESFKEKMESLQDIEDNSFLNEVTEGEVIEDAALSNLPSYEFANKDLDEQVDNLKKQMYESVEAYKQTLDIATTTQKELDAAKKALWELGNDTYNKKMAQNEDINTLGIKDKATLDLLVAYNMALDRNVAAQEELVKARTNKNEAEMAYVDATVDKAQEGLDNIEAYFGSLVDWYQNQQSFFESEMSNKKSLGIDLNRDDFNDQLNMIKEREKALWDDVEVQEAWLKAQVDAGNIQVNSEEYRKMQGAINDLASAANKASDEYRELEDEMRVELYIKPIDDAIEKLNDLSSALGNVNSMIVDAMKYDDAGRFTDYGLASLAVDVSDYNAAREEIEKLIQKREEYKKQFADNTTDYAESEFIKDMREVEKAISQATVDADGKRRKVISSIIAQAQEELKVTNELIKAERDRFNRQKTYRDYDRKLRDQNKELQMTRQQLAAIEGMNSCPYLFNCWNTLRDLSTTAQG